MKRLTLLITTLLLAIQPAVCQSIISPKHEYRAVWLTTFDNLDWPSTPATTPQGEQRQRDELCTLLDTLQALGFNTVLFQTRIRGDVSYPSLIEPFSAVFTGRRGQTPGYDPLRFAIEECHRRGMQCHAWMVALKVDANSYVDPSSAAVVSHLCTMVREVVNNYDVDGIHLDYIRYPERTHGEEQRRRDAVTNCMAEVYRTVKAAKPWLLVSAATLGKFADTSRASSRGWNAYHTVCQDAQLWLRNGYVDAVFPMLYYRDDHYFPFVDDWSAHAAGGQVITGLGLYQLDRREQNWPISTIRQQITYTRAFSHEPIPATPSYGNGTHGYALFRAGFIQNNTKDIRSELHHLNAAPALVPPLPGAPAGTPDSPKRLTLTHRGDNVLLRWSNANANGNVNGNGNSIPANGNVNGNANGNGNNIPAANNSAASTVSANISYVLYRSVGSPVNIANPAHILRVLPGTTNALTLPRPSRIADTHYALTTIDRYGRESKPLLLTDPAPHLHIVDTRLNPTPAKRL